MNDSPIGIFDSGIGGLTVLRALMARLPEEHFLYLGDTARLPYGTKSADTVARYSLQAAAALTRRNVKMLVVACNTASSAALPALQATLRTIPVIGVIAPGAEAAIAASPEGPIGVLATEGTVKGGAYVSAIQSRAPHMPVVQQACPLFVSLAEEGLISGEIATLVAHRYLDPLMATMPTPKAVVLGCTHFPVFKDVIARIVGPDVTLVDSAVTTAEEVARTLDASALGRRGAPRASSFLATDAPDRFARVGEIFLGRTIDPGAVELVDLQ